MAAGKQFSLGLMLFLWNLSLFGQVAPLPPPPPPPKPPPAVDEVFKVVEHMPRFPGCEDKGSEEERKACAQQSFLDFIYRNLEYPQEALEQGWEGTSVISFIVEKDGSVSTVEIIKDPGAGMGAAAAAVVEKQSQQGIRWTGMRSRGRALRVQFNIPIHFRLTEEGRAKALNGELDQY